MSKPICRIDQDERYRIRGERFAHCNATPMAFLCSVKLSIKCLCHNVGGLQLLASDDIDISIGNIAFGSFVHLKLNCSTLETHQTYRNLRASMVSILVSKVYVEEVEIIHHGIPGRHLPFDIFKEDELRLIRYLLINPKIYQ